MNPLHLALVGAVAVARVLELRVSARNARRLIAEGAVESGGGHYPWMIVLHVGFLAACVLEPWLLGRPWIPALAAAMAALVLAATALRWWAIRSLRGRWTTRVLVVPGRPVEVGGPYRWLRHPNYVAVQLEVVALPLVHAAWITAVGFGLLNLLLLRTRIRTEEEALRRHADYDARMGERPRFLPGRVRR